MAERVRKAVFPIGGLGTRFLPATKAMPKEMLPVVDKPLIQYAVEEALAAGIETFVFVTSRGKSLIEDHFDRGIELEATLERRAKTKELADIAATVLKPGQIVFTRQQEAMGLGHAVWCAREVVGDEPFAILLPDDLVLAKTPCLRQMVDARAATGGNLVAVIDVPRAHTNRYGILDIGKDDGRLAEVRGLVEKPEPAKAPSTLSIIGRYILEPAIFTHLARFERGAGNEIQLTDAMAKMIGTAPFHGLRFEGRRFDCGDKVGFVEANVAFALARADLRDQVRPAVESVLKTHS
ncbi:MAG: UTP--glucose-1-phosphate uridylyltransferase GalU [Alphaproteobacteria bacterium]|nr:UTP--glucose-1-phosphate uridylyltransferase GalU [Alphaproteobacteria bacterium]